MQKIELSICIVAFKADTQLRQCLSSIRLSKFNQPYEILVIDNTQGKSSVREIVNKYKDTFLINSGKNEGYGAGNNIALANATGKYVLIMNPDVVVKDDTISELIKFLKRHKNAAAVGTAYQTTKGTLVPLGTGELSPLRGIFALSFLNKFFPRNVFSKRYYLSSDMRKKETEVWSVAGSLAMFRRKALIDAGGYDENLFLYYEESELGRRLKKLGWDLWITNSTSFDHSVGRSTKAIQNDKLKIIFRNSRFYYFNKHFGLLKALIVECFARFGKFEAMLLAIIGLGGFLRFFRISDNLVFHGELGDNYLAMKNIFMTGKIPLLGPPTSHPWLSFGPLYYWFFAPVLLFVQYSPLGMAIVFAFLHTLLIVVNYFVIKALHSKKIAIISSFLIAVSPAYVSFAHESRFFSLTLLLFYGFYYFFAKQKYMYAGLFFAILLNFHLTPLVYIPALLLFIYLNNRKSVFDIQKRFFAGAFLGSVPFIVDSALHQFEMIKNMLLWIPYRIGGFLGLVHRNNVNRQITQSNLGSGIQFLKHTFLPINTYPLVSLVILIMLAIITFYALYKLRNKERKQTQILLLLLIFGYFAIFIHGDPPSHYYLPLYPVLILLVSIGLSKIRLRFLFVLLILLLTINMRFFFSEQWFYRNQTRISSELPVPYILQVKASNAIIKDALLQDFSLTRVGEWDEFSENYSQNYRYLLWKLGNEPIQNSPLIYTIYEDRTPLPDEKIIFSEGGLVVTKKYEIDTIIT